MKTTLVCLTPPSLQKRFGVRCEATFPFVPKSDQVLLQDIKVTNISDKALHVDVVPVYEFTHFDAPNSYSMRSINKNRRSLKAYQQESGHTVLEQYAFMREARLRSESDDSGSPCDVFDGDRQSFLVIWATVHGRRQKH
ncbi:hypothetical protein O9993_16185 [Vibrio lentus]|nr:hypothetical protein [Vibrio lentus]